MRRAADSNKENHHAPGCRVTRTRGNPTHGGAMRREHFEAVLRSGRRMTSRNFVVRVKPNEEGRARLGIIAARKIMPRAVDRNRAKRLIREVFRARERGLDAIDVVVQVRNNLRDVLNAAVREELNRLLSASPADDRRRTPGQ